MLGRTDWHHRTVAFGLGGVAVALGCVLLTVAGAPARMMLINFAALLIGLAILQCARRVGQLAVPQATWDWLLVGLSAIVPLTAMAGPDVDGVSRWLVVAGVTIQPSLIVAPLVAVAFARRPSPTVAIAVLVTALGLALQPDPSGAAMLWLGVVAATLANGRGSPRALQASSLAAATAALIWSLIHARALPPVPFVENVLADALTGGVVSASLCIAGLVAFFLPAGAMRDDRAAGLAFAGAWLGAFTMAALGPYPTPVVGFGGSAVLGYVLSLGMAGARRRSKGAVAGGAADDNSSADSTFRFVRQPN